MEQILTIEILSQELRMLGVKKGMSLLVHTSLSAFGCYVCGGANTVIQALCKTVGKNGTIMMPSHSSSFSEPAYWQNPPVASELWQTIRDTMPAFSPLYSPVEGMGKIPAQFVRMPTVKRSTHPMTSFAAWGKYASFLLNNHSLDYGMGENSPLARLLDIRGYVLFLGAPFESNTLLHLAEIRADITAKKNVRQGAPILKGKKRIWVEFDEIDYDNDDFDIMTREYCLQSVNVRHRNIKQAACVLIPAEELVHFACHWLEHNRQ